MRTNPFTFLSWMIVWYQFKIQRWWRLVQTTFMTWFDDIDETLLERWEDAPWWKKINKCRIEWIRLFGSYLMVVEKQFSQELKIDFIAFCFCDISRKWYFSGTFCVHCAASIYGVRPLMDSPNKKCGPIFFAFYSRYSSGDDHDSTPDFLEQCSNFCSGS